MIDIPEALAAHYALGTTTTAIGLRIVKKNGAVLGFTSHDIDDVIEGVTYESKPGVDPSDIVGSNDLSVANLEVQTLHDGEIFTTPDLVSGLWQYAGFTIFRYNYLDLTGGVQVLLAGNFGEINILQGIVRVELRSLAQLLQVAIGSLSSKTCRYRLGSTDKNNGGLCLKDLTDFTYGGSVTSVDNNIQFDDSVASFAGDFFGDGQLTWTTGENAGVSVKIRLFGSFKFTLYRSMFRNIQVGDTFTAIAGCRKRRDEDCVAKFDNAINFGGEPDRPGIDQLTQPAAANV